MLGGGAVAKGIRDLEFLRPTVLVVHSGEHRVSRAILAHSAKETVAHRKMS